MTILRALVLARCARSRSPAARSGPTTCGPTAPAPAAYKEADGWKIAQPARRRAPRGDVVGGLRRSRAQRARGAGRRHRTRRSRAAEARVRQATRRHAGVARARCSPVVGVERGAALAQQRGQRAAAAAPTARTTSSSARAGSSTCGAASAAASRRARRGAQASAADLANARLSVQAELAQNYFLLRVQDAQIALLQRHASTGVRALARSSRRTSTTPASSRAATSCRPKRSSSRPQAQAIDAQLSRAQLEHAIAVLIGKPPAELSLAPRTDVAAGVSRHSARACRPSCSSAGRTSPPPSGAAAAPTRRSASRRRRSSPRSRCPPRAACRAR